MDRVRWPHHPGEDRDGPRREELRRPRGRLRAQPRPGGPVQRRVCEATLKRVSSFFLCPPPTHTLSHARKRRGNRHTAYNLPFNPCSFPGRPARAGHPKGWACTVLPEGCGDGYGNSPRSEGERGSPTHHVHTLGCWSPEILKGRLNFARESFRNTERRGDTQQKRSHISSFLVSFLRGPMF